MSRAMMAAVLLLSVVLCGGCSGSDSGTGTGSGTGTVTQQDTGTTASSTPTRPGMTAAQIWNQAQIDAEQARAVHVVAKLLDGKDAISIDLQVTADQKATGDLVLGGHRLTVRRTGKVLYFKADKGYWEAFSDKATAKKFAAKWIKVTKGPAAMSPLFEFTGMSYFTDEAMDKSAADLKHLVRIPGIKIDGEQTIGLSDKPAGKATAESGTLYVAASGPPLPQTWTIGTDGSQYIRFQNWNQAVPVDAPQGAFDLDPYLAK
jgi:hypothetical protein